MESHDWEALTKQLATQISSSDPLLQEISTYLLKAGGKAIRPRLVLHCARLCGYEGKEHIKLACALEYIHVASLMHDDVLDHGQVRRRRACPHLLWGSAQAVLAGDFLLTEGVRLLTELRNWEAMDLVQQTTKGLLEGQLQERMISLSTPLSVYLHMVEKKTAIFFAAACKGGALIAQGSPAQCLALYQYGLLLGMGYQLLDDILEYERPFSAWMEKGHDFFERKATYPLLLAYQKGPPCLQDDLREALRDPSSSKDLAFSLHPYLDQARTHASSYAQKAQQILLTCWTPDQAQGLLDFQSSLAFSQSSSPL